MINAIELIRVSTDAQAGEDKAGIPAQRTVNRITAARFGLNIVESIEITDVCGANVLMAPEIRRLVELIDSPNIGAVVTREFSRLMRPERFSDYALLQAFADSRTKLFLPEGPIDFSEKSGRLMGTIRAAIAGLERTEIQERCWRGKEEKRKAGKKVSSTVPFGVGYDKRRGWFYTEQAAQVRKAFDMILSGITCYATVAKRTGLSQGQMFTLLHNPIWTGMRVYEWKCDPLKRQVRPDGRQGYSHKVRREDSDVIRVRVIDRPLLTDREWSSACKIMDSKREVSRRERTSPSLYCGFLFCAQCNSPMIPVRAGHRARYYICRNRRKPGAFGPRCEQPYQRADRLEAEVDRVLAREVTSKSFAQKIAAQMESNRKGQRNDATIERLETELRLSQTMRDRTVDAYISGMISRTECDDRVKSVDARIALIARELAEAQHLQDPGLTPEAIARAFEPFHVWDMLGREDRRRILSVTIPRIRVNDYQIVSLYRLLDGCDVAIGAASGQTLTRRTEKSQSCLSGFSATQPRGLWIELRVA